MRCGWQETANTLLKHLDEMGQRQDIRKPITFSHDLSLWLLYLALNSPLLLATALYFMMIQSILTFKKKRKKKFQGHFEPPALVSPPTVEWCHSKPSVVPGSLFNLYHWTAEEHHATRLAYISEAPLSHTHCLHQLTSVLFPLGCHSNHSNFFFKHFCGEEMKRTWLWQSTHSGCTQMQLVDIRALNG